MLGADRFLCSADYPFESVAEASEWVENAPLTDQERAQVCAGNARQLFQLKKRGRINVPERRLRRGLVA